MSTKKNRRIYLDYAATTPLDPRVLRVMMPYLKNYFGNAGSVYEEGVVAKRALLSLRAKVARSLQCREAEVVFTSGGTESNNLAIFGAVPRFNLGSAKRLNLGTGEKIHIVTTNIEHSSVLEPIRELERRGAAVTYVAVGENGIVDPKEIAKALRPETALVSVAYANNEIGTVQPIREISRVIKNYGSELRIKNYESRKEQGPKIHNSKFIIHNSRSGKPFRPVFHCDASQAPLYLNCSLDYLGADLVTLDGHKMYGPKGVGALIVKRGTPLTPVFFGGGQEGGLRPGTENIPAIVGFAEALALAVRGREKESARLTKLREYLYSLIRTNKRMGEVILNGDEKKRLPNNVNIFLLGVDTEFSVIQLDRHGIAVSTKSSCLRDEEESYVVKALGGDPRRAKSSLRISLGHGTTKKDIDFFIQTLQNLLSHHQ